MIHNKQPPTLAHTCAFYAKIGVKNFGNRRKALRDKEIFFLFFLEIAR